MGFDTYLSIVGFQVLDINPAGFGLVPAFCVHMAKSRDKKCHNDQYRRIRQLEKWVLVALDVKSTLQTCSLNMNHNI